MLTIRKANKDTWYLEYNGRFVESFDKKYEAVKYKIELEKSKLIPN